MIARLLIIAASALAGALGTLFIRRAVGDEPCLPPLPEQIFRPRRRAPRTQLDMRPDGQSVAQ